MSTLSGAWGELLCREVNLEQPVEYVAFEKTEWSGPRWYLGPRSAAEAAQALEQVGCDRALIGKLLATQETDPNGQLVLKPADETVLALGPELRSKLYLLLAENPLNPRQAAPVYIPEGNTERFFRGKFEGEKDVAGLARRLGYRRNDFFYFSDWEVLARAAGLNAEDRVKLRLALSATPVVMARVKVAATSNIDALVNYWALSIPGVQVKDLRPLFDAQRQLPGGGAVSILYVLPPLARSNLYTTPMPPQNGQALPDCHFTALNFFNETADPRLSDLAFASRYIAENYYEIGAPGRPGDLVILLDSQGRVIHSATYLAGNVVYTKNGVNLGQPWVLMHLEDMIGAYSVREKVRVGYMRKRSG